MDFGEVFVIEVSVFASLLTQFVQMKRVHVICVFIMNNNSSNNNDITDIMMEMLPPQSES